MVSKNGRLATWYAGLSSPCTTSPGLKSVKRYGPVPTGLRLAGASRDFAPRYASNTCLGSSIPRLPQKASHQKGCGLLKTILTVWLSRVSTRVISRYAPLVTAAVAGSATYSQLKTTSSAVNGLPSCQVTPRLSRHVTQVRSLARVPLPALGISAARIGHEVAVGIEAGERLVEDARRVLVLGAGGEVRVQERRRLPPERLERAARRRGGSGRTPGTSAGPRRAPPRPASGRRGGR